MEQKDFNDIKRPERNAGKKSIPSSGFEKEESANSASISDKSAKYPHSDLTQKIIGCAFTVHNQLGGGFMEKVYEEALIIEMEKAGLIVEQQKHLHVYYKGEVVGNYIADLVVNKIVLLELKAVKSIMKEFEAKLIHYLKSTSMEIGLLINFGDSVQIKRKINSLSNVNYPKNQKIQPTQSEPFDYRHPDNHEENS